MRNGQRSHDGFEEAIRYLRNGRALLRQCKVEDDLYVDMKPVREAFGTIWLAVEIALRTALMERGLASGQIPRSWEALLAVATRRLAVRNGRLTRLLNAAHEAVHIAGYYYGDTRTPVMAHGAYEVARKVLETLSGRKIG